MNFWIGSELEKNSVQNVALISFWISTEFLFELGTGR